MVVGPRRRMLPTVRAVAISRSEESTQEKKTREDEDRVLAALLSNPDASIADIADTCGWTFASGEPAKSRVQRAITRIDAGANACGGCCGCADKLPEVYEWVGVAAPR